MRKKYFALIMAGIMCSVTFLSGCGAGTDSASEIIEEDEDDEEEEEDEDDRGRDDSEDEDEKPAENEIVSKIDDETLYSQIEIFLDNRDKIFFPDTEDYSFTTCMVCDLDFNGRCELVLSGGRWYGAELENRIYEIDETGDGYYIPNYAFLGMDSDQNVLPEIANFNFLDAFYDKNESRFHYLVPLSIADSDDSDQYGFRYCDISLKNGIIQNEIYGKYQYRYTDNGYEATYYSPGGELSEDEFNEYIDSYPGDHVVKRMSFGTYEGTSYYPLSDGDIETMDADLLKEILADSYRVFVGTMPGDEFRRIHSTHSNDYDDADELLHDIVGSWGLYLTDTEGDITYYTSDSEYYMTVDIYEDGSFDLDRFVNTEYEFIISGVLEADENSNLSYVYTPDSDEEMGGSTLEIVVCEINMDGMMVISTSSMYGNEYMGGSTWYFVRLV